MPWTPTTPAALPDHQHGQRSAGERAWAAKDYTRLDTIKPDGTYQVGEDGFMEFYPDADALQQAVLQLFYEKVE